MTHYKAKALMIVLGITALVASPHAEAENGFYVGGAFGKAFVDESIDGNRIDADSSAFRVFAGYEFNQHFAVEGGYLDLGTIRDTITVGTVEVPVSASADGFTLAAVGQVPLGERFSAYGHLGVWFNKGETTVAGMSESGDSERDPYVGVGIGYDLSDAFELNAGVDYIDAEEVNPLLATVGFTLRF